MITAGEFLAILGGLAGGYWIASKITDRGSISQPEQQASFKEAVRSSQQEQSKEEPKEHPKPEDTFSPEYIRRNWFHILDVPEHAPREVIVAAYKQLINQYHPDKVAQLGKELRDLAELKSKQINMAYEHAMKLRA
jgi:DnaJ-domain-containing protein 1